MKKMTRILLTFILLVFFTKNELYSQAKWDYPVKPGTAEWEAFLTHDEMLKAIQIPDDILSTLTTKELVEICLNYPLSIDLYAYNSLQEGLRKNIAVHFNGVQELLRRDDNLQCLLDLLKSNDLLLVPRGNMSIFQTGESIIKHSFMEVLLSHESVLAGANSEQEKEIALIAVKNMTLKESQYQLYSRSSLEASAYLLCACLTKMNKGIVLSPNLEIFLKEGSFQDINVITEELKHKFVKF